MEKKLIQEIKRMKELSNIKESKLDENFIDDITDFIGSGYNGLFDNNNIKKTTSNIKSFIDNLTTTKNTTSTFDIPTTDNFNKEMGDGITSSDDYFYKKILEGIGAPWNTKTKLMMYSWRRAEGGPCKNNPFNSMMSLPDVKTSCCNSVCVKNYPTSQDGIKATIQTLINGKGTIYNYDGIIDGLKNSNTSQFIEGLRNSKWGTNTDLVETILKDYYSGVSKRPPTEIS